MEKQIPLLNNGFNCSLVLEFASIEAFSHQEFNYLELSFQS
jgi:hypothetical protein